MTGTTNPLFGVKIVYNASGNKTITNPVVNGRNTVVRYFRERQYFYPIAWDDVALSWHRSESGVGGDVVLHRLSC